MNLNRFFEQFDHFTDAPDAVVRMRELILQLAVRGKLVSQCASDEPASTLLANARSQRSTLVVKRKIKARILGSISAREEPFEIPPNWRWVQLADVGYELGQKVPDKHFTYIDVGSIDSTSGRVGASAQILAASEAPSRARKLVLQGTVIYSTVRPYLLNTAIIDRDFDPKPIASTAFGILHPFEGVSGRYLLYWLRSAAFTEYVEREMKGMAYPAINDERFYSGYIPLPPSAEQMRIVAKVDELMALCDRLDVQQKEREARQIVLSRAAIARFDEAPAPANLNYLFRGSYSIAPADLRKTILNLAVRGRIVPQDPDEESAKAGLERLGLRCANDLEIGANSEDAVIPESWSNVRFEDIAVIAGGVTLGRKLNDRKTLTLPYLRVANVKRGEIDVGEMKEVAIAEDEIDRYALAEGDLLLTEGGDWDKVGRAAIWDGRISPCLHQNHIFRARMRSPGIAPYWFERYFNSPQGRVYFELASKQTTNLASINMRQVRACPIPFPPIAEQNRIILKLDQLMALVNQLETQLATADTTARKLLDSVVHELLYPSTNVVELPSISRDRLSDRTAIACYTIQRLAQNPNFGRTMLMKVCYLSETHLGLSLGWQPMRQAAGPYDSEIENFESLGKRSDWFTVTEKSLNNGHTKVEYGATAGLNAKAAEAIPTLGSQKAEFDRLLNLFKSKSTEEAEIIATLFAAWNDFLIDGKAPTDDEVIREVRENWHPTKQRFTRSRLEQWLGWIRHHSLIPKGNPPRTRQQLSLPLN